MPLAHDDTVLPARRIAQRTIPGRRQSARPAATEGPQVRRRNAGIDLQRDADRRGASPGRLFERVRRPLIAISAWCRYRQPHNRLQTMTDKLKPLREQIDAIDAQLLD